MNASTSTLQPVREGERTVVLDVLRGFALFGILQVNFWGQSGTTVPRLDAATETVLEVVFAGSFYPLFSLLFGVGFGVQLLRARERGSGVALLYLRRMVVLFIIGTVHAVFIWNGDVLVTYATLGLFLVPLGRLPDRALLAFILVFTCVQIGQDRVTTAVRGLSGMDRQTQELHTGARQELSSVSANVDGRADMREASYATTAVMRWAMYGRDVGFYFRWDRLLRSEILLLFLIGMYLARRRVLERAADHRRSFVVLAVTSALAIGLSHAYSKLGLDWGAAAGILHWWFVDLGPTVLYLSVITLLFTTFSRAAGALHGFSWAGRMGLTNYLLQSVVMTLLFMQYGLGLPPLTTTAQALFSVTFFFLFQIPLSRWWLQRYQYGPAEWLWRSLTYGVAQPMLRAAAVPRSLPEPGIAATA